ncbi:MAG: YebC/PmpR family DNA-binding transcriptional regulator [Candidatus Nealsonbacteria bacterium CG08_land_8_20_14_0_20_38_20]|uniref:Probable transcriptional regulatory protein COT33_02945 n=1 Tax=Candidatus Nealsonbacteria bacterium CG08_land_8_20_14_0_20_38_20 TaxID=1974705 RepID=A0A2H0YL81_9BACT|nr:MAG: YebC/PmpR family DNA-binding transcriptional regulator [Candidatus Nealsonbacteria bacterium CG08_land_8_20_14_0_20_38_20]
MSGHSHFKSIKGQKALTDSKRSQAFSRMAREIAVAAKEGGDPEFNFKLRIAIEKARSENMPTENIERAIKKGEGGLGEEKLEEVLFEAYGPGGIAIMIEGITDNKKRTLNEIKRVLQGNGGKLVGEGAIKWMFKRKGVITTNFQFFNFQTKEKLELAAIEAGAEDIYWHNDLLDIWTNPEELGRVKKNLEEKGIKPDSVSLDWVAKETVGLEKKEKDACQKLFEALDEADSVQEIYSNLN